MAVKHLLISDHSEKEMHPTEFTFAAFTIGFIKHVLISLTSFIGTPNSVRILYSTSLLID